MDTNLRKIQELELLIAKEVKRICEKNHIPYFICAGTLLGAVRHEGFIPWDDDIDIGMIRSDYDRFLEACTTDLRKEFFLQTWDTDPAFPFSYAKVRLKGTHITERFAEGTKIQDGIFVDVFPYDNVPDSPYKAKIQAMWYYVCKRILWIKKGFGKNMKRESVKQAIKYCLFSLLASFFSYKGVKAWFWKRQQKYNHILTENVVTDGTYSYQKEALKRDWVNNLEEITFEKEVFLSVKNRHAYLEYLYGDYMVPPPVEKRGGHEIISVDFGNYETI